MKDKELLFKEEFDWKDRNTIDDEEIKDRETNLFLKGMLTGIFMLAVIEIVLSIVQTM